MPEILSPEHLAPASVLSGHCVLISLNKLGLFLDRSMTLTFPQDQFRLPCTLINNLLNHIHCVRYGCCKVLVAEVHNCNEDGMAQGTTMFPNEFASRV